MAKKPDVTHLKALKRDPQNRRRRTARSAAMLVESIKDVGAGRSIVIDEDDRILAGNGVLDAAVQAGIEKVHVVETDGDTVVAVRRRNLTPEQKRRLAMYDNRTGELAEWDVDQLRADREAGLDLDAFFAADEVDALLAEPVEKQAVVEEVDTSPVADTFWISVRGPLAQQAHALQQLRVLMGELAGVTVELGTIAAAVDEMI